MYIALGYGVLFASTITLFLVPAAYVILDDLTKLRRRGRRLGTPSAREAQELPSPS